MSVRLAGSPQGRGRSPGEKLRGASAREKLASAIREAVEEVSRRGKERFWREIPGIGARVGVELWYPGKVVWVIFEDVLVFSGKPEKCDVAQVFVWAEDYTHEVRLRSFDSLPSTWRPPPSLNLLPAALNAALSILGTDEVLDKGLGVRLRARGVSFRRMFDADDLRRRPVVLVGFDVNGKPLTLSNLEVWLDHEGGAWRAHISCHALLHHGDRKLAKRLFVLAWLRRELDEALRKHCEEKGYFYEKTYFDDIKMHIFRVGVGDKEVEVVLPYISVLFDEEHVLSRIWIPHRRGDEASLAEKIMKEGARELEEVDRRSREGFARLVEKVNALLSSGDPRLKELGILLALLIKKAYEEAERAIPG